jgi:hypothetical protein
VVKRGRGEDTLEAAWRDSSDLPPEQRAKIKALVTAGNATGDENAVVVQRPIDVVDIREEQVKFWKEPNDLNRQLSMSGRYSSGTTTYEQEAELARRWLHGTLRDAELYWVSPDMCKLLAHVAQSIPEVHPEPVVPEGLVVFSVPIRGIDSQSDDPIYTVAFLWGSVTVINVPCLEIETFGWRNIMTPGGMSDETVALFRQVMPTRLVSTGGSEWPVAATTSDFSHLRQFGEQQMDSMLEDRRLLAAFWSLCAQRITTERKEYTPRPATRRLQREGISVNPVRVITLREASTSAEPDSPHAVDWSHRWLVTGYWRQQPYGEKSQFRRAQYIAPFVKGPKDKPLILRDTVRALRR